MNKLVIADAGPLIAFARLHRIGLLPQIFGRVLVTDIVFAECAGRPDRAYRVVSQTFDPSPS